MNTRILQTILPKISKENPALISRMNIGEMSSNIGQLWKILNVRKTVLSYIYDF